MIAVRLIGGLGNQMFQYAAGRSLALRHGCELRLDTSDFAGYSLHQGYELASVFGIKSQQCERQIKDTIRASREHSITRRLFKLWPSFKLGRLPVVKEPHFQYWQGWQNLGSPTYLSGYWQSELYFNDFADKIRQDFQFKNPLDKLSVEIADEIDTSISVSLHVRRGDYVSNPKTTAIHGLCEAPYYTNAIEHMADRLGTMRMFVFSDDIEWARANLPLGAHSHIFVDHNKGADSWRDMLLMSRCKHHVIANSTFSWWGAWLNSSKEKIVIAPQRWFAKAVDTSNLVPRKWIRL